MIICPVPLLIRSAVSAVIPLSAAVHQLRVWGKSLQHLDDISQECLVRAYEKSGIWSVMPENKKKAYLATLAIRTANDYLKKYVCYTDNLKHDVCNYDNICNGMRCRYDKESGTAWYGPTLFSIFSFGFVLPVRISRPLQARFVSGIPFCLCNKKQPRGTRFPSNLIFVMPAFFVNVNRTDRNVVREGEFKSWQNIYIKMLILCRGDDVFYHLPLPCGEQMV